MPASLTCVDNERQNLGDYPSDPLIHCLADTSEANEEELLILAKRVPDPIKKRFLQRSDAFRAFAGCDDETLDKLMNEIVKTPKPRKAKTKINLKRAANRMPDQLALDSIGSRLYLPYYLSCLIFQSCS